MQLAQRWPWVSQFERKDSVERFNMAGEATSTIIPLKKTLRNKVDTSVVSFLWMQMTMASFILAIFCGAVIRHAVVSKRMIRSITKRG